MKRKIVLATLLLALAWLPLAQAQVAYQTGAISGVVTDSQGKPVPNMTVAAESPALLGKAATVTDRNGGYRLINLAPGTYSLTASMQGFKTVKQPGIEVRIGQAFTVNVRAEISAVQEEITIAAAPPMVDTQSPKMASVVTAEMIRDLPLNRDLYAVFNTVPGATGTVGGWGGQINGGTMSSTTYEIDGVSNNSPTDNMPLVTIQYDSMEEIEIARGALPAQIGNTGGSFVNIVTKSGGNKFHGQLQAYYTREELAQNLYPEEEIRALGQGVPVRPFYDLTTSASLGGPIKKDKIWFYTVLARSGLKNHVNFVPAKLGGKSYETYEDPDVNYEGFLKLTAQISKKLRFFTMVNARDRERDVFDPGARKTYDNTFTLKKNTWTAATSDLTWLVDPNTYVDFRVGYAKRWYPITAKDEFRNNPGIRDDFTGYEWNGVFNQESYITRRSTQGSIRMNHYRDNLLGANHEFAAGLEYFHGFDRYGYAKGNPISYRWYNGNQYYYVGQTGAPHALYGDGRINVRNAGRESGETYKDLIDNRLTFYLQDKVVIKNRLTLHIGARLDRWTGGFGGGFSSGSPGLPLEIGKTLQPTLGFNPFGAMEVAEITDLMAFNTLSPRLGASFDVFGNGKTALKASWSRYAEGVSVNRFSAVSPGIGEAYEFGWFDLNRNGVADNPGTDRYEPLDLGALRASRPNMDVMRGKIGTLKAPTYDEMTLGFTREVARNISIGAQYLHKRGYNTYEWNRYDRTTGRYWYRYDQAPEWWVPFTTTVPAVANYPAQTVTAYFMSSKAPVSNQFYLQETRPDFKRRYNAIEVNLDKRYSNGWGLGGNIVYSKLMNFWGANDPNGYVNGYGRDGLDRPLSIKLFGTFRMPLSFVGSFTYRYTSGAPAARAVSVWAPNDWRAANGVWAGWSSSSVMLEESGARRYPDYSNVDLRVQKDFRNKIGTWSVFVDIFNALGNRYESFDINPGGDWRPTTANGTAGTYAPGYNWGKITGLNGVRIFKLSGRLTF